MPLKEFEMVVYSIKRNILFSLIVTTVFTFILLVVGEIYARFFWKGDFIDPGVDKIRSLEYHDSIFSRNVFPQKKQAVFMRKRNLDGTIGDDIVININEKGYRGRIFQVIKPKQTTRIMFYGGSAVFDASGGDWPHRTETELRERGFSEVEVINAGIPGHATYDSLGRFFSEGHTFAPDYVVLYNTWNDIKYFRFEEPLLRTQNSSSILIDPRLSYHGSIDRILCGNSKIYLLLRDMRLALRHRLGPEGVKPRGEFRSEINELALRQFRLNVQMFVDVVRNVGSVPILMTQARLVASENTNIQKKRIGYHYVLLTHDALCEAFDKTDEIIKDVAKKKGVFLIDASKQITGKDYAFEDHIHLTPQGSKELAEMTAQHLAELLNKRKMAEKGSPGPF